MTVSIQIHPFLARLYHSTGSCCCHSDDGVSVGIGMGVTLQSFTSKFFYVIGKALSGELYCTGTDLVIIFYFIFIYLFIYLFFDNLRQHIWWWPAFHQEMKHIQYNGFLYCNSV